jgi:hypothetical protein
MQKSAEQTRESKMAIQVDGSKNKPVKTTATGNAADTGTPVSLPPIKPAKVAAPDVVSQTRNEQNAGSHYGLNGYRGPSSLNPGEAVKSPLADNMSGDDTVLAAVQKFGSAAMRAPEVGDDVEDVKGTPATQIRKIADSNVPDHSAFASARTRQPSYPGPRETIPSTLGATAEQPVRKPGA